MIGSESLKNRGSHPQERRQFLQTNSLAGIGAFVGYPRLEVSATSAEDSPLSISGRALVIGIDKTDHADCLTQPTHDACTFVKWLVEEAKVPPQYIVLLTNPILKKPPVEKVRVFQANVDNILAYAMEVAAWPFPGERLFFYFSGHGLQYPESHLERSRPIGDPDDGIVPCDYKPKSSKKPISVIGILDLFKDSKYTQQFFFFDCCRKGGTYDKDVPLPVGNLTGGDMGKESTHQYILYSSSPGQPTVDQVGAFSSKLIDALSRGFGRSKTFDSQLGAYLIFWDRVAQFLIDYFNDKKYRIPIERAHRNGKTVFMQPEKRARPDNIPSGSYPLLATLKEVAPAKLSLKIEGADAALIGLLRIKLMDGIGNPQRIPPPKVEPAMSIPLPFRNDYSIEVTSSDGSLSDPVGTRIIKLENSLDDEYCLTIPLARNKNGAVAGTDHRTTAESTPPRQEMRGEQQRAKEFVFGQLQQAGEMVNQDPDGAVRKLAFVRDFVRIAPSLEHGTRDAVHRQARDLERAIVQQNTLDRATFENRVLMAPIEPSLWPEIFAQMELPRVEASTHRLSASNPLATLMVCNLDGSVSFTSDGQVLAGLARLDVPVAELANGTYLIRYVAPGEASVERTISLGSHVEKHVFFTDDDHDSSRIREAISVYASAIRVADSMGSTLQSPSKTLPSAVAPVAQAPKAATEMLVVKVPPHATYFHPSWKEHTGGFRIFLFPAVDAPDRGSLTFPRVDLRLHRLDHDGDHALHPQRIDGSNVQVCELDAKPGPFFLSMREPEREIRFALMLLPGHRCDVMLQQEPTGKILITQFAPKSQPPERQSSEFERKRAWRHRLALLHIESSLQNSTSDSYLPAAQLEASVGDNIDAMTEILAAYIHMPGELSASPITQRLRSSYDLRMHGENLVKRYPDLADGHVALAISAESGETWDHEAAASEYRKALNCGLPILQTFLQSLWVGVRRYGIKHERSDLLRTAAINRIPGLLWSAWKHRKNAE